MQVQQQKVGVASLSVASNVMLVIVKLVVGKHIGSVSVMSEAIHSGVDLLAAVIALYAVNTAHKPADQDHPFGHGKIENISGAVEALLIFGAAVWIIYEAIQRLFFHGAALTTMGWGVGVMLISAVANLLVSHLLFKVGKASDSVALQADAWHLRTDVYTSAGVMGGLALIWIGQHVLPGTNLQWIDPVAAIAVALLILKTAYVLTRDAVRDLLDARLPQEEEAWIRDYLARLYPTVRGFHHLRTRKSGPVRFIELDLQVKAEMSVEDSHRISEVLACDIKDHYPQSNVNVHIEPCNGRCTPHCLTGCLMSEEERAATQAEHRK